MINVNKLFRRLSIQAKLVTAFCLLGVIPVAVVGGYGNVQSFILLNDAIQDHLSAGVVMKAEEIQRFLREVKRDVLFLSRLPTLQAFINLRPEDRGQRKNLLDRLGKEFLTFSQAHQAYYQVRCIDERGREVVRADYDGEHYYLVPSDRLQDKSDRYYFREAMATPPGAIYVSPMDRNIEWGTVEVPYRPVVRHAVALRSTKGEPRGVVIINVYVSHILGHVLAGEHEKEHISLVSSAGFYLSHSQWIGNVAGLNREEQLLKDFTADHVTTILSEKAGAVVEPGLRGRIVVFAPIFPHQDRPGEFWVLLHVYPKAAVLASSYSLQVLVLVLGGGVLVAALMAGVVAARHFTRPITALIRGAEAIAAGDFDHPIQIETNDELEDLGHQFTRMATHLKEHERQLRRQVRDLVRLEERERIGQDLHDGIIQSIYATGLELEECVRLTDEAPGEVKMQLEQVIEDLNVVIRDVRNYIVGLSPERLQDRDLGQTLADLARGLSLNALLDLDLSVEPGINGALTPEQASHFFHICREAFTNVVRHALASKVALIIKRGKGVLLLTVKDDGVGFDPSRYVGAGQGLRNMGERVRCLGGSLSIESAPGLGARITVEVPLEEAA